MPPVQELTADRPLTPAVAIPGVVRRHWVALAVVVLAAASLLLPSEPTYDPWAWLVWGREILHFDLSTADGPSWKPLPILFTTVFAVAGNAAPDLWLVVARAGVLAGIVVMFRLVRRLGGGVVGGTAAAAAYTLAPWTIRNGALGNSEGLLVLCSLWAVDRHVAGHRRQAFALGLCAALLRPEAWPFFGLYGLWLAWRVPRARPLVAAGFAVLPVLWFLPELWGSGDLLRAVHRAQQPVPGSPAAADHPLGAVLGRFATMLTASVWVGLAALALVIAWRRFPGQRELRVTLALLVSGAALAVEVGFMASGGGFSGSTRYLMLPAAVLIVVAGIGIGWAVRAVLGARARRPMAALGLAALGAVAFAAPNNQRVGPAVHEVRYETYLTEDLDSAVRQAGGRARLLACGRPFTGPFEVPKVAWQLHLHTGDVGFEPQPPGVLFRSSSDGVSARAPSLQSVGGNRHVHTLARTHYWRIVETCGPAAGPA